MQLSANVLEDRKESRHEALDDWFVFSRCDDDVGGM